MSKHRCVCVWGGDVCALGMKMCVCAAPCTTVCCVHMRVGKMQVHLHVSKNLHVCMCRSVLKGGVEICAVMFARMRVYGCMCGVYVHVGMKMCACVHAAPCTAVCTCM